MNHEDDGVRTLTIDQIIEETGDANIGTLTRLMDTHNVRTVRKDTIYYLINNKFIEQARLRAILDNGVTRHYNEGENWYPLPELAMLASYNPRYFRKRLEDVYRRSGRELRRKNGIQITSHKAGNIAGRIEKIRIVSFYYVAPDMFRSVTQTREVNSKKIIHHALDYYKRYGFRIEALDVPIGYETCYAFAFFTAIRQGIQVQDSFQEMVKTLLQKGINPSKFGAEHVETVLDAVRYLKEKIRPVDLNLLEGRKI